MASCEPEEISTKTKLSKLHCPFTWDILDSVTRHIVTHFKNNKDDELYDEATCNLELLLRNLFKCYKTVLSAQDDEATQSIEMAEDLLMQIQQDKELSQTIRAIEHVFYSTKCFFLYEKERLDELEEILSNITDDFSSVETGALHGCQSVIWSCLNDFGMDNAVDNAMKAIELNEDCALWHFILAKNLRRQRRIVNLLDEVTNLEEKHFELAYAISTNNSVFGIYYIQMRLEKFFKYNRNRDYMARKAANERTVLQMARNILNMKPSSYKVLLKLALMFLRASSDETPTAKQCLDAVEKIAPNNSTFMHYAGMLYEACGEYKDALTYYKKAADLNNFVAEFAYIRYGWETGELQPLQHLLRMLKKYERSVKERLISLYLAIATVYYSLCKDKRAAAEYFLKALAVDPQSKKFKVYYKFLDFSAPSIHTFLNNFFLYEIERERITGYQEITKKIRTALSTEKDVNDVSKEEEKEEEEEEEC